MMGLDLSLSISLTSGSASFDPASLFAGAEAGAWYDPSDLSTLWQDTAGTTPVTADGDPVARIDDKSGNGKNLLQAGAGIQPLYKTDGTLHWLLFDGTDDTIQLTLWNISQPIDRVSSLQQDTWGANRYMMDGGAVDELILRQNGTTPDLQTYAGSASASNAAATLGSPAVVSERYNGASSELIVGATTVSGDFGANNMTGLTLGSRAAGAPYCPFRLYGLILRERMTAGEHTSVREYLAGKAGI